MMYDEKKMRKSVRLFIEAIGESLQDSGLKDTPARVANMYAKLLNGYTEDPKVHCTVWPYNNSDGEYILMKNVTFYSFCKHHLLPFFGTISMAYVPKGNYLGLSKLVRFARIYAKRLQVQEDLTEQIASGIYNTVNPKSVIVHTRASHLCMSIRGVRSPGVVVEKLSHKGDVSESDISKFLQQIKTDDNTFKY